MSQLNPNAAEFVPISPKRTTASPSHEKIMDDLVIAQSPRREPNDYDIKVPNLQEFETEIKLRPSNVQECGTGDETDDECALTSQEIMENLLNGKSIEEIEFQPNSTPVKFGGKGEFHFGPNSSPFVTPTGFMDQSTKAVVGDNSNYLENADLDSSSDLIAYRTSIKEDPMSTSFYQDKDDNEDNLFDLNKVQVLPENIDDFLEKPKHDTEKSFCDTTTISDLSEHNKLEENNISKPFGLKDDIVESNLPPGSVELVSESSAVSLGTLTTDDELKFTDIIESSIPIPKNQSPVLEDSSEVCPRLQSQIEHSETDKSPIMNVDENLVIDFNKPAQESLLDVKESNVIESDVSDPLHSSDSEQEDKLPAVKLLQDPATFEEDLCMNRIAAVSDTCNLFETPKSLIDLPVPPSPEIQSVITPHTIVQELESPIDDVTSSVKDSPLLVSSPAEDQIYENLLGTDDAFVNHETESIATTDVNSFLERSLLPDIASPLSGDETQFLGACNTVMENLEIKSETIIPEYPVPIVTTPSEESKTEDLQGEEISVVAATTASPVISSIISEKKCASKPKTGVTTKKPLTKPSGVTAKPLTKPPLTKQIVSKTITAAPVSQLKATTTTKTSTSMASKVIPKEKKLISTKTVEKKVVNGDATKPLTKKLTPTTATRSPSAKSVPAKDNTMKTVTEIKTTTRPATVPLAKVTSKLSSARLPQATAKSTTSNRSTTPKTSSAAGVAVSKPKPSPNLKPLAPDTKKQMKETTNKQITSATASKVLGTSSKTSSTKSPVTGSTLTKTATGGKVDVKKPSELIRHTAAKSKSTTSGIVKKTKMVTNGLATKVTPTMIGGSLIKDDSSIIHNMDNSQVLEVNAD